MSEPRPEILFVHGLWMHGCVFALHRRRLRAMGWRSHAYSYPSLRGSLAGAADGLVFAWGYDSANAALVLDASGNGRDGTMGPGPGTETRLYRLSGVAGESLVFAPQQDAYANIRILGPSGLLLRGPEYPRVLDPFVLPESGEYLIAIEGYPYEGRPVSYSLLAVPPVRSDLSLTVGERVDGTLAAVGAAHAFVNVRYRVTSIAATVRSSSLRRI